MVLSRTLEPLPEPKWFACHTAARQEDVAYRSLTRTGLWAWLPMERVRRLKPKTGTTENIHRPIFPRYLFFALRYRHEPAVMIDSLTMEGVSTVVKSPFTGQWLQIPNPVIDALMEIEDSGRWDIDLVPKKDRKKFEKDQPVKFKAGSPYEDLMMALVDEDLGKEVRLWLQGRTFLGKEHVTVAPETIEEEVAVNG